MQRKGDEREFDIDLKSRSPIYEQLNRKFKIMIIQGVLETDEKLPTVSQLAQSITINPNTIEKAYRDLESEGYIYTVQGKGRFAADVRPTVNAERHDVLIRDLEFIVQELIALGFSTDEIKKKIDTMQSDAGKGKDQ